MVEAALSALTSWAPSSPSSLPRRGTHCSGFSPVWMRLWMTRLLLVRKERAQNSQM